MDEMYSNCFCGFLSENLLRPDENCAEVEKIAIPAWQQKAECRVPDVPYMWAYIDSGTFYSLVPYSSQNRGDIFRCPQAAHCLL